MGGLIFRDLSILLGQSVLKKKKSMCYTLKVQVLPPLFCPQRKGTRVMFFNKEKRMGKSSSLLKSRVLIFFSGKIGGV